MRCCCMQSSAYDRSFADPSKLTFKKGTSELLLHAVLDLFTDTSKLALKKGTYELLLHAVLGLQPFIC